MESEELRLDEFFQRLREIQKNERNVSGLANVGDNFYNEVHIYLNKLIKEIGNNPLSFYSYLHRDARRIAAEICERREHKIINSALINIQRSQGLFNENSSKNGSDFPALPPQNMTPEEENLYYSIAQSFSKYRKENIDSLNNFKVKSEPSSTEIEKDNLKTTEPKVKSSLKDKKRKKAPLGIEQDIESYQSYEIPDEIPEIEEPNYIPDDPEIAEVEISKPQDENQVKTLIILEELPSIMGVDREIYGPLMPQDVVTMPEANAQIIIKNNKGKFIKKYEKIAYK